MAIIKISSDNENLSYVIQKNPNTGMILKNHKGGVLFGYYPIYDGKLSTTEYIIQFKDASDYVSYKNHPDEQFEYLNTSRYNDARFINDAIQEMLHSARESKKPSDEYDIPALHSVSVMLCNTEFKTIDIFKRFFPAVEIIYTHVIANNYAIQFVSKDKMTLGYLLKLVSLFGIFATLNSPVYNFFTEDLVAKYIRIANDIDAPYFIKYLIKIRMCRSENKFKQFKEQLEKSNSTKIQMMMGDTHQMRIDWIKERISTDKSIVDIGTGIDFRYMKLYAPILQEAGLMYYSIEKDPDAFARIKAAVKNRGWSDVVLQFDSIESFYEYHNDLLKGEQFNVICTEVLEHNEYAIAKSIVKNVLKNINYDKFIVTVPNKEFNCNYGIEGFRHDDHKWEANVTDIQGLIPKTLLESKQFDLLSIGDIVDDQPVSFGLIFNN